MLPQKPKRKSKKRPDHIESLPPLELEAALKRLQELDIAVVSKGVLADILKSASNPNAERIDYAVKTLEPVRRKMVEKTAKGLRDLSTEILKRGKERLEKISDSEWQRLIDDEIN